MKKKKQNIYKTSHRFHISDPAVIYSILTKHSGYRSEQWCITESESQSVRPSDIQEKWWSKLPQIYRKTEIESVIVTKQMRTTNDWIIVTNHAPKTCKENTDHCMENTDTCKRENTDICKREYGRMQGKYWHLQGEYRHMQERIRTPARRIQAPVWRNQTPVWRIQTFV